ncbi:uncharacterized protein LOC110456001 [Mizuhopecten yessoensis]|nr:uncharacterized protein LOC110456001 [Mizuhopecten yessoensis]
MQLERPLILSSLMQSINLLQCSGRIHVVTRLTNSSDRFSGPSPLNDVKTDHLRIRPCANFILGRYGNLSQSCSSLLSHLDVTVSGGSGVLDGFRRRFSIKTPNIFTKTMKTALSCLVLAALFSQGLSTCTYSQGRREITAFGSTRYLCDYPTTANGSRASITFEFGSKFSTSDCNECECTADGMRCCGFGVKSGTPIFAPVGCQVVADGCRARVVSMSDNRTDCYAYNQYRRPSSGPFDPFMSSPYDMFGMRGYGGMNAMGQRRGPLDGAEMESEGLLPMLLPLLMGSNPGMGPGGMVGGMSEGMAGGMAEGTAGTAGLARSNAGAGNGAGADAETGAYGPAMNPFQGLSRMPPLMRLLFMSSMMAS